MFSAAVCQDGKYEVIFPVAVPDEGTFDWLDEFLEKNPEYVELLGLRFCYSFGKLPV